MADFLTIQKKSEGIYKEKGSKFIAYAYPIKTEEEVRPLLKSLKKEYYDARHHCYAFVLGKDKKRFRAADDGEPSNSAGAPILGQIRSLDLTNVLVVVVRYFGGTKLGVPGLITAYREAAKDALNQSTIVGKYELESIDITFDYVKMNNVMKLIKEFDIKLIDQGYESDCTMKLSFKKSTAKVFKEKLSEVVLSIIEL